MTDGTQNTLNEILLVTDLAAIQFESSPISAVTPTSIDAMRSDRHHRKRKLARAGVSVTFTVFRRRCLRATDHDQTHGSGNLSIPGELP